MKKTQKPKVTIITGRTCTRCPVVKRRLTEICREHGISLETVDMEQLPVDLETDLAMEGIIVMSLPVLVIRSGETLVGVNASQPDADWAAELEDIIGGSKE